MKREGNIQQAADRHYGYRFDEEMRGLVGCAGGNVESFEYEGETLDSDEALERLQEMPLSFEKLLTDHRHGLITWEILLGTGGPADRVLVVTDYRGMIESAEYQFQDWFQPWTAAENQDAELVQRFADIVGYYEDRS